MYGLILDSVQKFICECYGERYWAMIRRRANLKNQWFVTHEVYDDSVMADLVIAAAAELGLEPDTVMRLFGEYFAKIIGRYGYARLLRVLGRSLSDFLNGLDDLHEYLRFSYPKMSPPSFFCEDETPEGMLLHYTTKRKGYLQYVIGQLITVGRIYGKKLEINIVSEEVTESGNTHYAIELKFDNSELLNARGPSLEHKNFSIDAQTFLGVFPFSVLLDKDLVIWRVGVKLHEVLPNLVGESFKDCFTIRKPILDSLNWRMICLHANCVFELVSIPPVQRATHPYSPGAGMDYTVPPPNLRLKGQMLPLSEDVEMIAFLCSPMMDSPEDLYETGIYINDLAMHDSSRDIILAGSQKDPELNLALNQEKIRSAQLEESIQQTDRLLFHLIPKPIADKLRNGETPLNTCREFSCVSILFSDIVSFTPMCSRIHPMEVVCVLNAMYVAFDKLCEIHHVYKLETIGDAYMVLCGAPIPTVHHAEYTTDFALSIIKATSKINDPSTGKSLRIRVGIHSGNVVAGVVGSTVLRYDVFGDTVNVAARMEATGLPMKVHISEATAELLDGAAFHIKERGMMEVKGKGKMKTFWVDGKTSLSPTTPCEFEDDTKSLGLPSPASSHENDTSIPVTTSPLHTNEITTLQNGPPIEPSATFPSFQSHRMSLPVIQTPPEEPGIFHSTSARQSGVSTPSRTPSRALSPKPDVWPLADHELSKYDYAASAFDLSVPPGVGRDSRRHTAPVIQPILRVHSPPPMIPCIPKPPTKPTLSRVPSSNSHSINSFSNSLWTQQQLMEWGCPSSNFTTQSPTKIAPQLHKQLSQKTLQRVSKSEFNLVALQKTVSESLVALNEPSPETISEMEELAAELDANAQRTQNLAEWVSDLVHRMKDGGHACKPCIIGTPVDHPAEEAAFTNSTCSVQLNSSGPIGQPGEHTSTNKRLTMKTSHNPEQSHQCTIS